MVVAPAALFTDFPPPSDAVVALAGIFGSFVVVRHKLGVPVGLVVPAVTSSVDETPARGERRCQRNKGKYACARRKMTGLMSGSAQGHLKRHAVMPGTMKTTPSRCLHLRYLADEVARVANDERWRQAAFPSRFSCVLSLFYS